jgi:superfamily II DNA or RNA helicase
VKTDILDFFYSHADDYEWHEGLDLYTTGKVKGVEGIHSLVTGKVSSHTQINFEVRLKIHPTGRFIQWVECTCRKNRTSGAFCEHIIATMVSIHHDHPKLLPNIDANMPLKAPVPTVRKKKLSTPSEADIQKEKKSDGAAQSIINHLKNIHSIRLMAHGPTLRIRAEARAGEYKNYSLELDDAGKFLQLNPSPENASSEVRELKVFQEGMSLGTHIYFEEEEKIIAERVVGIKVDKHLAEKLPKLQKSYTLHRCKQVSSENIDGIIDSKFIFIPIKSAQRLVGKEFFFLPEVGYWQIPKEQIVDSWYELPMKRSFKEDAAAKFAASNYGEYFESAPIWLDQDLDVPQIDRNQDLILNGFDQIEVHQVKDGWFYLDPQYKDAEASVSMIELMKHFRKKRRQYLKTDKGWFKIPDIVKESEWSLDETGQFLKVDGLGLMRLKAAIGEFDQFVGSKKLLNQIRSKTEFTEGQKTPSLRHTNLNLRGYQEVGLEWMWWLFQNGLHGLLADEMGLGKTHQAMALMSAIQTGKPNAKYLVIAPTTVLDHWEDKANEFCPNLKPIKHHGSKRTHNISRLLNDHHLIITSYGVLIRDIKQLSEIAWDSLMLDEAHFVKNNDTATYRAACKLNAGIRLCLTGTPIENNLSELKSIYDFLVPGFLGSDDYFKKNFMTPIAKDSGEHEELALQKMIHPFKLRRNKAQVLPDLPEKVEDIRHCNLSTDQVKLYKKILDMKGKPLIEKLKEESSQVPYLHVFATLTLLKQICNHPSLIGDNPSYSKGESGKFELLKEILEEALGSEHKVVIYSQYVEMIKIISRYLEDQNIGHTTLTGSTRNRGAVIKKFQTDPDCRVFVGSLLAGGIGIDLTAASVVVHYDRWWNASKENQATDRVYRIGQNKNVLVLKLVTRGTLEEKIDRLIESKRQLFEKFMDKDEELFGSLTRSQLIDLLND